MGKWCVREIDRQRSKQMSQLETKIEATHRLQRDGRWVEASVYREKVRVENREKGMKRKEANEVSWAAMIAQFPPATGRIAVSNAVTADQPYSEYCNQVPDPSAEQLQTPSRDAVASALSALGLLGDVK